MPNTQQSLKPRHRPPKIAIFLHLYYQDLWFEFNTALQAIHVTFDLFVTIGKAGDTSAISARIKEDYPRAVVIVVENRGLDIGGFMTALNYCFDQQLNYDYFLKLHSKKSLAIDPKVGEAWRRRSIASLCSSHRKVCQIISMFEDDPLLGMLGPVGTLTTWSAHDSQCGYPVNRTAMNELSQRLNIVDNLIRDNLVEFIGGTMFWARWQVFADKFKDHRLCADDFEEGYAGDGLRSHAMERLFACLVRDAGLTVKEAALGPATERSLRVAWVVPGFGIGGGRRVIVEIARLQNTIHHVDLFVLGQAPASEWIKTSVQQLIYTNIIEASDLLESGNYDAIFATGWQTVEVVKLIKTCTRKLYFIQDYEPWFRNADKRIAEASYTELPNGVCVSEWIRETVSAKHNVSPIVVRQGGLLEPRRECPSRQHFAAAKLKVLFYFKPGHYGRSPDLVEELLTWLATDSRIECHVFGHGRPSGAYVFHGELTDEGLVRLYRECHAFVDVSRHRGVPLAAMEAAAFGVVPILSHPEMGVADYGFRGGENCLLVGDPDRELARVVSLIRELDKNRTLLATLSDAVYELSRSFDWWTCVNDINLLMEAGFGPINDPLPSNGSQVAHATEPSRRLRLPIRSPGRTGVGRA